MHTIVKFLSLNIYYVICSIVNKILAHVIYSNLKRPNISAIRVVKKIKIIIIIIIIIAVVVVIIVIII